MNEHLTKKAAKWFNNLQTWESFVELSLLQRDIEKVWFEAATEKLRKYFTQYSSPGWTFEDWGAATDTWWFLEEFGKESIGIGFGWCYLFCFGVYYGNRIDRSSLTENLKKKAYQPLIEKFGRQDKTDERGAEVMTFVQYGDFSFDSPLDMKLPIHELAWYAGNKTDLFVNQAVAKIEAFTCNAEITALLRQLNTELIQQAQ